MKVVDLASLGAGSAIEADLAIVGGGPAGLTLALEFAGSRTKVVVLESGPATADPRWSSLSRLESIGEPRSPEQLEKRLTFHGGSLPAFSNAEQPYGVRCRQLGGASEAWAGKSALLDETDFAARDWVPFSGWPVSRKALAPFAERAAEHLNLGPNIYDDRLWEALSVKPPQPAIDAARLRSFFWQFSRSRVNAMDVMRFAAEVRDKPAPNVTVFVNATATAITTNEAGNSVDRLEVSTLDGARSHVTAKAFVLAAGGIETPRLMLASTARSKDGVGNARGVVGRYLMDHPGARIGQFAPTDFAPIERRFGFYGLKRNGVAHMYMHGLTPSPEVQREEGLLNCSAYVMGLRAIDDPWDSLRRLLKRRSDNPLRDAWSFASHPAIVAKGLGRRAFESRFMPKPLKDWVVNQMIRSNPNFVVEEFQSRGLPHKLVGIAVDAITEQIPDADSRVTLSPDRTDALGMPLARADWRIHDAELRTLSRLGRLMAEEMPRAGLPAPVLEDWVRDGKGRGPIIDMAHTIGTTRMSDDPATGVVNADCKVHGVERLYIAGSSVFPTSGHANPTLMLLSLTVRLADHLKASVLA